MNQGIGIAVLGLGRMGYEHCRQILGTQGLSLRGCSSRSQEQAAQAKEKFGVKMYSSHEELLNKTDASWIVIATYTNEHKKWALEGIGANKNLIIEKPVALNYEDASDIFNAAGKRGIKVVVHMNRRWDLDFMLIQSVLKRGLLGNVYRIESRCCYFPRDFAGLAEGAEKKPWRLTKKYGGGILLDWGTHLFDQLIVLMPDKINSIFGRLENIIWGKEVEDHFWAEILFENGITARVEASYNNRITLPRWFIIGDKGTLSLNGGMPEEWNSAVAVCDYGGFKEEIRFNTEHSEFSTGFYSSFVESVSQNKPLPVKQYETLKVAKTIDLVRKSSSIKALLKWR